MAEIKDLLNEVRKHYDVVLLENRGTTAGNKIFEYDLWYRDKDTGVIRYKRLHIYKDKYGNAFWYSENPIPQEITTSISWTEEINAKMNEIAEGEGILHWLIDSADDKRKTAVLKAWTDDGSRLIEKKIFLAKRSDGSWDIRIRD